MSRDTVMLGRISDKCPLTSTIPLSPEVQVNHLMIYKTIQMPIFIGKNNDAKK